MPQYLARLVFEVSVDGRHDQFDRQLRLFFAPDETAAIEACLAVACEEEGTFISRRGDTLCWRFVGISFFRDLTSQAQGELLESDTMLEEGPEAYRRYVQLLDADIRSKTLTLA